MRLVICLIAACALRAQPSNRRRKHGDDASDEPRPRKQARVASTEFSEEVTTTAPSATTSTTCDADHLIQAGLCICNEDPCFHHESMLHIKNGRQIPFLMKNVMIALGHFLSISPEHSVYDVHFNPSLLDQLRERVVALATAVRPIYDLLNLAEAGAAEVHSDHGDRGRREGQSKNIKDFLGRIVRPQLFSFRHKVNAFKHTLETVSTSHSIRVPVLYMQALQIIEVALLGTGYSRNLRRGWNDDITRLGVKIDSILPCVTFVTSIEDHVDPIDDIDDLQTKLTLVYELDDDMDFFEMTDVPQLERFARVLESVSESRHPRSSEIAVHIRETFCPDAWELLAYVLRVDFQSDRAAGKLITDFIRFCDFSIERRLELTQEFMYTFEYGFVFDPKARPVRLGLPVRDASQYHRKSTKALESASKAHRFPYGIDIYYSDTGGIGDGIRRDWFERMVKHYFRIYDPDHPSLASNPTHFTHEFLWEYSDDTQTAIRPRGYDVARTEEHQEEMKWRFRACGRLIGIGIRYGIIPGISLSPSTLAHLHRPRDDFDAMELAAREDSVFAKNLDKLRLTEWENSAAVGSTIGHLRVRQAGAEVPVTRENIDKYIHKEKFNKVVWSMHREMHAVLSGISDFIRPHTLDLFSEDEIGLLIRGVVEVTPDMIISGIEFPTADRQSKWLVEIITEMTENELKCFHKFVTGSSQPPIRAGEPGYTWMMYESSEALPKKNLPTARNCFGTFTSPTYDDKTHFETKLKQAITMTGTVELQ